MIPINTQSPMKSDRSPAGEVLLHSCFYTIQGEGPYVGRPAVFIRLAGCNLQCPGCDTEYTKGARLMDVGEVCKLAVATLDAPNRKYAPLAVITGGEPFRQNILPLMKGLRANGFEIQVETNGTLSPFQFDGEAMEHAARRFKLFEVVVSPKAGKVHPHLYPFIIAYKYVLNHGSVLLKDGLPSSVLGMPAAPARPHDGYAGPIYVQAADEPNGYEGMGHDERSKNDLNQRRAIKSAMEFNYTLAVQIHKIIGLE